MINIELTFSVLAAAFHFAAAVIELLARFM
jgi:hypothetical protein